MVDVAGILKLADHGKSKCVTCVFASIYKTVLRAIIQTAT